MTRLRQQANCLRSAEQSIADLHEQLGRYIAGGREKFFAGGQGGHTYDPRAELLRDLEIDSFTRPVRRAPRLPDTPEVQALRLDWERTEAAAQLAWDSFKKHRNPKRYRAEMAAISSLGESNRG